MDGFTEVRLPSGEMICFDGCPVTHLDGESGMWLSCYRWLNVWHQGPMQRWGIGPERLDPRFEEIMELIDATMAMLRDDKPAAEA